MIVGIEQPLTSAPFSFLSTSSRPSRDPAALGSHSPTSLRNEQRAISLLLNACHKSLLASLLSPPSPPTHPTPLHRIHPPSPIPQRSHSLLVLASRVPHLRLRTRHFPSFLSNFTLFFYSSWILSNTPLAFRNLYQPCETYICSLFIYFFFCFSIVM